MHDPLRDPRVLVVMYDIDAQNMTNELQRTAERTIIIQGTRAEMPGASLEIAGLSVIDRLLKQLTRAGMRVILISDGAVDLPAAASLGAGVKLVLLTPEPPDASSDASLDASLDAPPDGRLAPALAAVRSSEPGAILLTADLFFLRLPAAAAGAGAWRASAGPADSTAAGVRVTDEATRRSCEDRLFEDLLRGDLGFVARHLNKKLSFRITRYVLCRLPITPNQVTIGSALLGLAGCGLIATGSAPLTVVGMAAAQLQSVLDGCDGELARVRFQQSAIGEWLDSLMDDGLNLALVLAITLGLWRTGWGIPALLLGGVTASMFLVYNVVSYRELVRQRLGGELLKIRWKLNRGRDMKAVWATPGAIGPTRRLILTLGRRDTFVFGWLVLAFLHLLPGALLWAFLVAVPCFVTAVAELLLPDVATPRLDR